MTMTALVPVDRCDAIEAGNVRLHDRLVGDAHGYRQRAILDSVGAS